MRGCTLINAFKNKTLLITGGTGSFGSTVLNKLLDKDMKEIRVFSRDEKKQNDMRLEHLDDRVKFFLGDVRDYESVSDSTRGVNYIFHAAALKQVPSCEFYPLEIVVNINNFRISSWYPSKSLMSYLMMFKYTIKIN